MENEFYNELVIPTTYNGILEFIQENRIKISQDFNLILKIYNVLDNLLKRANTMGDLHKDTTIILETIKLQLDSFIKEYKNEISFEKLLQMADNDEMDDFYKQIKLNSQKMTFLDNLDFEYSAKAVAEKREPTKYNDKEGETVIPDAIKTLDQQSEATLDIQEIKNRALTEKEIEFFYLIFDEDSFTQTIRNAFNLSLALRMKQVSIKMIDSCLMVIPYDDSHTELNHSVFEMTPIQYENLKRRLTQGEN